ncbi:Crp/Fnr family transcriptional regulator [Myroides ceti]|uniref:Crp/Fnr family transcriptional regulator n=1 Tax=Paenimyroides ceti TaxID=395087 RepID=A0ABT8CNW7_9FLAO|nr:Crp/Fnr family transcriptional regulator [Paenimyroides ceti]MDN3705884.1 Crp/Fnr family transcriptional regulator [Paenimyroides ceti]
MNALVQLFKKFGNIPPEVEKVLTDKSGYLIKDKGDFFLKQGQTVSSLFVMEKGAVRAYFIKDGKEVNSWFGFEHEFLGSILPLFANQPSFENIQFLEPSILYYIPIKDLNKLYREYPEMNDIGRKIAEDYCRILEERIISLQTESAEQRYHTLLKSNRNELQRISLGQIASYLGVTQETLSRIRKNSRF